jgi:Catalase
MMQGFGVNTYTLHTLGGEQCFVKFHWIPELGVHSLIWDEALKISGQDPGMFSSFDYLRESQMLARFPSERPVRGHRKWSLSEVEVLHPSHSSIKGT